MFQFHIGSIKTKGGNMPKYLIAKFQFHIGSIKTMG